MPIQKAGPFPQLALASFQNSSARELCPMRLRPRTKIPIPPQWAKPAREASDGFSRRNSGSARAAQKLRWMTPPRERQAAQLLADFPRLDLINEEPQYPLKDRELLLAAEATSNASESASRTGRKERRSSAGPRQTRKP